ncbi:tetratricopeptide repeat protein [Belliella sp. R4-6]|uniref:Tetratricopeptide repeat protein n=1 Tax=Belliella alkalica TaxID=1730871 RepID=A0ABS9V6T7_9BACT|nr:tetratricopeptide repeat protein [Belliella alkalica]MCH7412130.1 tetratricopeptide repeat protein [Belliella alkalica]
MSNLSRIETLKSYAESEPENPFNWYALALEFRNEDPQMALHYFNKLLNDHKVYLPTYYHAAALCSDLNLIDEAKKIYEDGISLAKLQQNSHALRELQNSYQNFLFDQDLI